MRAMMLSLIDHVIRYSNKIDHFYFSLSKDKKRTMVYIGQHENTDIVNGVL